MDLTTRTETKRLSARASRDWDAIVPILDSAFLAHVGFCVNAQPFVIPMLYGRDGERLYLHGSVASRLLGELGQGIPVSLGITLVDGLVLSRSAFDSSMNYRSVVAFGTARILEDPPAKLSGLRAISEHLISGRWADVRPPSEKELRATTVLEVTLEEASAKSRSGPPLDSERDSEWQVWAGTLPLTMRSGPAIADSELAPGMALPDYVTHYDERLSRRREPTKALATTA
jgi:nitroimidazol reductase NimA-like FMN-containing flavoprotein (pyridoxamine 5'-phosphate oxidase superfamily)